jgi:hypothetical protein
VSARGVRVDRRRFGDGAPCRVVEVRTDRLETLRLQAPSRIRARDTAHILSLQIGAGVETLALPPLSVRASFAPPEMWQHDGDTFPGLRGALSAWWTRTDAAEREVLLESGAGEIARFVTALRRRGLIATHRHGLDGQPPRLVAPIGTLGYPRQVGHVLRDALLFNTHYFLFDPRELDSPLAAIGDPVGMLARGGRIRQPPIVRRGTLIRADGRWQVERLGVADLAIDLPDGTVVDAGASDDGGPTLRYRGDGVEVAPSAAYEVCLQGRHVSLVRSGGGLLVPHGGLVLSFANAPDVEVLRALVARPTVTYRIPRFPDLTTALQAGPQLVRDGEVVVGAPSFTDEGFRTLGTPDPTAPINFPADADRTRAGRVGIGVTREGSLVILAIEGTSSLSAANPDAPTGCTLTELAEALLEAGAVEALNCDGGGSTQVFAGPGELLGSTDARAVVGGRFDRPVPVVGVVG